MQSQFPNTSTLQFFCNNQIANQIFIKKESSFLVRQGKSREKHHKSKSEMIQKMKKSKSEDLHYLGLEHARVFSQVTLC